MLNIDLRINWELKLVLPLVILHLITERKLKNFHLGLKSVAFNTLLSVSSNT